MTIVAGIPLILMCISYVIIKIVLAAINAEVKSTCR
jgi:hypothetical protein